MPQLRQDIVTGRWVAVATERARRPDSFTQAAKEAVAANTVCPFCTGNEHMTPPEVLSYRSNSSTPDTPGWSLRVVPNLYAAFKLELEGQDRVNGLFPVRDAVGACEVLISSPDHAAATPQLPLPQVEQMVRAYRQRMAYHAQNRNLEYVLVLYNHGRPAGASLEHPHSQLYAVAVVPPTVQEELLGARRFWQSHGVCAFCRLVEEEERAGERVVLANDRFLVYTPYASRTPFETWIVPRRHRAPFLDIDPEEQGALAVALRTTLGRLQTGLNDPPYNFYIHTAPLKSDCEAFYHWHLEILPKLSVWAGFELGTGIMINVARPEDAAAFLRSAQPVDKASG